MIVLMFAGVLLISLSLTYAWWVKVRVVCLRQDIFDVRDALFDAALEADSLDDLAYCRTRNRLNMLAKTADIISLPVIIRVAAMSIEDESELKSENVALQTAIDVANTACVNRIGYYLRRETISGWIVSAMMTVSRLGFMAEDTGYKFISRWVLSRSSERLVHARKEYRNIRRCSDDLPKSMGAPHATV